MWRVVRNGRWLALCLLGSLLWLTGCARVDPVVKIGLVGPFEGRYRAVGYDVVYSARLAVRQINEAGGINGYRVALVALDDGGDPALAQETAVALTLDPAVIAVVGHWQPETTAVAAPIYTAAELPFIAAGQPPFAATDPTALPAAFRQAYEAVTPFDETPGPQAAAAYDAFQLLWLALEQLTAVGAPVDRQNVANALSAIKYEGLSGLVFVTR